VAVGRLDLWRDDDQWQSAIHEELNLPGGI
jgi:hypothetical protein